MMATQPQESPTRTEPKPEEQKTEEAKQIAEKGVKSLQPFGPNSRMTGS